MFKMGPLLVTDDNKVGIAKKNYKDFKEFCSLLYSDISSLLSYRQKRELETNTYIPLSIYES